MQRFAKWSFSVVFILSCLTSVRFAGADDLDQLLKDDPVWAAVKGEESIREIEPVLAVLLLNRWPSLDPSKAYEKASIELRESIQALLRLRRDGIENALAESLLASPEAIVDIGRLKASRNRLRAALGELPAKSGRLELYLRLADAVADSLFLAEGTKYESPAEFDALLGELKNALLDYAAAPRSGVERENLGRIFRLLEMFARADRSASIDPLLVSLRRLCRKPNVWLFVSETVINDLVDSKVPAINEPQNVNECILGTAIRGTAQVSAKPRISLRECSEYAAMTIHLDGHAYSDTIGHQKPVRIKSTGQTSFRSSKCLNLPAFLTGPAAANACTNTTICSIQKVGRQCLSRLIERIAWKRALEQKSQAEAIASQKFARRLEASFDERLDPLVEKARQFYEDKVRLPLRRLRIFPDELKFSSTRAAVGIGAAFAEPDQLGAPPVKLPPAPHRAT